MTCIDHQKKLEIEKRCDKNTEISIKCLIADTETLFSLSSFIHINKGRSEVQHYGSLYKSYKNPHPHPLDQVQMMS